MRDEILAEADKLIQQEDFDSVYDLLTPFMNCNDDEILWRLALSMYELNWEKPMTKERRKMIEQAMLITQRALHINENNANVHKVLGPLIDAHNKNIGVNVRLKQALKIKSHMMRAAELDTEDPHALYMLGQWYYNVADLAWPLKRILKMIFTADFEASFEQALACFLKALEKENLDDYRWYLVTLLLCAKCYAKLGNTAEAILYLKKVTSLRVKFKTDRKAKVEAEMLLKQLQK